jgi:hypothetical protein
MECGRIVAGRPCKLTLPPERFWINDLDIKRKTGRPDSRLGRGVRAAFVQGFGWESLTTNSTSFHEWGAAAPEILLVCFIRVHSHCNNGQALKFGPTKKRRTGHFPR